MQYKFVPERENYEPYAGGSVIYAAPGHTAFPIRLGNEIFRRCLAFRAAQGAAARCTLYDPCCGGGYHLTTLAYFNWTSIDRIIGSDISAEAVTLAGRNLGLLHMSGLERRMAEISGMAAQFGKDSHALALENALLLQQQLATFLQDHPIATQVFQADATDSRAVAAALAGARPDVVISDIPYGWRSNWSADSLALAEDVDPVHALLDSLLPVLASKAVVAIAAAKTDKVRHERYHRLDKFQLGKRQIVILRPNEA